MKHSKEIVKDVKVLSNDYFAKHSSSAFTPRIPNIRVTTAVQKLKPLSSLSTSSHNSRDCLKKSASTDKKPNLFQCRLNTQRCNNDIETLKSSMYVNVCNELTTTFSGKTNHNMKLRIKKDLARIRSSTELTFAKSKWDRIFDNYDMELKRREKMRQSMNQRKIDQEKESDEAIALTCQRLHKEIEDYEIEKNEQRRLRIRTRVYLKKYT